MRIVLDDLRDNWEDEFMIHLPIQLHKYVICNAEFLEEERLAANPENVKPATHFIYAVMDLKFYKYPLTFISKLRERLADDFRVLIVFNPSLRGDPDYDQIYANLIKDYPDRVKYWDKAFKLFIDELIEEGVDVESLQEKANMESIT